MKKNREILVEKIHNGISKPFSDELIRLIRPAIRILPAKASSNPNSLSKFGGTPLLAKGTDWIRNHSTNHPYAFLLQLDLEEMEAFDVENQLPKKGLLSVWFNLETWDDGQVIYYQDKNELVKANLPLEFHEEEKRKKLPFWKRFFTKRTGFKLFPEYYINFELEYDTPSWDSLQLKLFHLKNGTNPRDVEIDEKFIDVYHNENLSDHHLFGYYVGLQEPIYELRGIIKEGFPKQLTEALISEGLQWKLLLQIDSDHTINMSWGDWGKILFFIRKDDLRKEHFENLIVQVDST